ncbi:MAG: peptidylprolyl isomerase [Magnetococcales bacterium]|nr:peptidylprolyl isomerase [Magnetococcales bacterium]
MIQTLSPKHLPSRALKEPFGASLPRCQPVHQRAACAWVLAAGLLATPLPAAAGNLLDGIAAVAEGEIITLSEVDRMANPLLQRLRADGGNPDPERVRRRVLDELILVRLQESKAAKLGIKVTPADIDQVMTDMARKNGLTPAEFPGALRMQGIAPDQYREEIRQKLLQSRLVRQVIHPMVIVTQEDLRDLQRTTREPTRGPEEVRLGHILLAVNENLSAAEVDKLRERAQWLVQQLQGGASLADLASQYSDDPSALKEGDMGWFKRDDLLPAIETAVFGQPRGAVVGPVRSAQGLHVFKILELGKGIPVSDPTVAEVQARHILIKLPPSPSPDQLDKARQRIDALATELANGADFTTLARQHSEDSSASQGGDLGWFGRGVMVAPFEEAAFKLEPGQVSAPVRSPFGWHLIRLDNKRRQEQESLGEAQLKELEERLRESRVKARYNQWLKDLRLRAFVEIR